MGDGCGEPAGDSLQRPLRPPSAASSGSTAGSFRRAGATRSRNAENLESVGISARAMQRFLTEARWSDSHRAVAGILGPQAHPEAVWVFDGSDFPKQGRKSAGVARQYCGRLGKVANCQGGMFLAYVSPLGRALVDKRLYLEFRRCAAAGVPDTARRRSWPWSCWSGPWKGPDGMSPSFREGLEALGMWYVLDVPGSTTVWPLEPAWTSPSGRPRKPRLRSGQRRTMEQRSDELPDEAWREITVAEGSQGPRSYRSVPSGCGLPGSASPARNCGPSGAEIWTAASLLTTHLRTQPWMGRGRFQVALQFNSCYEYEIGADCPGITT